MSIPFTWIYLIHDPFTGLYKIGRSDNPDRRMADLKEEATLGPAPKNYQLINAWLCEERMEYQLHKEFADRRRRGEWFELYPGDVDFIGSALLFNCVRWSTNTSLLEERYREQVGELLALQSVRSHPQPMSSTRPIGGWEKIV